MAKDKKKKKKKPPVLKAKIFKIPGITAYVAAVWELEPGLAWMVRFREADHKKEDAEWNSIEDPKMFAVYSAFRKMWRTRHGSCSFTEFSSDAYGDAHTVQIEKLN